MKKILLTMTISLSIMFVGCTSQNIQLKVDDINISINKNKELVFLDEVVKGVEINTFLADTEEIPTGEVLVLDYSKIDSSVDEILFNLIRKDIENNYTENVIGGKIKDEDIKNYLKNPSNKIEDIKAKIQAKEEYIYLGVVECFYKEVEEIIISSIENISEDINIEENEENNIIKVINYGHYDEIKDAYKNGEGAKFIVLNPDYRSKSFEEHEASFYTGYLKEDVPKSNIEIIEDGYNSFDKKSEIYKVDVSKGEDITFISTTEAISQDKHLFNVSIENVNGELIDIEFIKNEGNKYIYKTKPFEEDMTVKIKTSQHREKEQSYSIWI